MMIHLYHKKQILDKNLPNCCDFKQMENVSLMIEILKIDMEVAVSYCFLTFCAAGSIRSNND